ncbi:hypothetical protein ERY430_40187 [Erythrobacter sp. EC-HK427]|nr:hypothetical protein ERY430_40187 [Erythrobacter sp. EC-HK427]
MGLKRNRVSRDLRVTRNLAILRSKQQIAVTIEIASVPLAQSDLPTGVFAEKHSSG